MSQPTERLLHVTAIAAALAAALPAQDWVQAAAGGFLPVRNGASATYDLTRNEVVMFGGAMDGSTGGGLADTWTWNGTVWTQQTPATVPPTRWLAGMSYDVARGVVVMFGGRIHAGPAGPTGMQNDLWEWNGTDWTAIQAVNPPAGRYSPQLVYDVARARHVLYGGVDGANVSFLETWEYDPATQTWTLVPTTSSPGQRVYAAMAYDQGRNRTVLYGGRDDAFAAVAPLFWEYDGSNWTSVAPANPPGDMHSHVMVYDLTRQRIVIQGGRGAAFHSGTWEYDGVHCYRFGSETSPAPGSANAAAAYDLVRNRTVVCGGYSTTFARTADTWERVPDRPSFATFGVGCAGSAGTPELQLVNLPALGTTFRVDLVNLPATAGFAYFVIGFSNTVWNSTPLPLDLAILGMPGCTGYVSADGSVLRPAAGGASWSLPLPNNPSLAGLRFYVQGLSLQQSPFTVSNAGEALIW